MSVARLEPDRTDPCFAWLAQLPVAAFALDVQGRVVAWNAAIERLTATPAAAVVGSHEPWRAFADVPQAMLAQRLLAGEGRPQAGDDGAAGVEAAGVEELSSWWPPALDREVLASTQATRLRAADGRCIGAVQTFVEQSAGLRAGMRFQRIFESSPDPVWIIENNTFVDCNDAAVALLGYHSREALLNTHPSQLSPPQQPCGTDSYDKAERMMALAVRNGVHRFEWVHLRADGQPFDAEVTLARLEVGGRHAIYCTWRDISARKAAEARVDWLAHHDALTSLWNRHGLQHCLEQSIAAACAHGSKLALVFLDLDHFKWVNDSLGHHGGDRVLVEVGRRLRGCVRGSDIVARLGGDEFVVVLADIAASADVVQATRHLQVALSAPYEVDGRLLHLTPSMGVSLFPDDGNDASALLREADTAMYHAKSSGRNNTQFYAREMTARATARLDLERDLRHALDHGGFELHFQPLVDCRTRQRLGFEALLRWQHPRRGLVMPDSFIGVAEDCGLILPIGAWILDAACAQMRAWREVGRMPRQVAINLSVHQLRQDDLVDQLAAALVRHGIEPARIVLEITETAAMERPEHAIAQLRALRDLGVELAIDDFGTGYSSLARLQSLPLQSLKLDRGFVRCLEHNRGDAAICAATVALAHKLGLAVIAEGVETPGQEAFLVEQGCDVLQGYRYGLPQPARFWTEEDRVGPAAA
jgi:diguanylate cyclase (GGDEF)-like protein/PAS domain S-box-containing protein